MGCIPAWFTHIASWVAGFGDWIVRLSEHAAWPIVVGVIFFLFRKPIRTRIERSAVTGKHGSTEITIHQPDPLEATIVTENTPPISRLERPVGVDVGGHQAVDLPQGTSNPRLFPQTVMNSERDALRRALESAPVDERDPWVKMCLMEARVLIAYSAINNAIFQSQIDGLRLLSERGTVTLAEAKAFYETERAKWPDIHRTGFDGWVSYLTRGNLVIVDPDTVAITDFGRGYLEYLRLAYPTQIKPF